MSDPAGGPPEHPISPWRVAAAAAVLAGFVFIAIVLVPVYFHNLELENFLRETQPVPDEMLRQIILVKGRSLKLDIPPERLDIRRSPGGRAAVRYVVRVNLALYTVDLHFSSNIQAISR